MRSTSRSPRAPDRRLADLYLVFSTIHEPDEANRELRIARFEGRGVDRDAMILRVLLVALALAPWLTLLPIGGPFAVLAQALVWSPRFMAPASSRAARGPHAPSDPRDLGRVAALTASAGSPSPSASTRSRPR